MAATFFNVFFAEKQLDHQVYEVIAPGGTPNFIPTFQVIEQIKRTKGQEARQIEMIIRKIDFANGDLHHFLRHLAQGLAFDTF